MSFPPDRSHRPNRPLLIALYLNAALLGCGIVALISRGNGSAAMAAPAMPPLAGGNGVYVMPGQMAQNLWGCFLLDADRQTLAAYEYNPGVKQLKLVAARSFEHDRDLKNFNTTPSPAEIQKIVELGNSAIRGQQPVDGAPATKPQDEPGPGGSSPLVPTGPSSTRPLGAQTEFVPKASDIDNAASKPAR